MPWRPAHETHAIERVSITVQFAEGVPPRLWASIIASTTLEVQALGFNVTVDEAFVGAPNGSGMIPQVFFPQMAVNSVGQNVMQTQTLQTPDGRTFQLVENGDVVEQVSVRKTQFNYIAFKYVSWIALKQRMESLLSKALTHILETNFLHLLKVEYWDKFVFEGDPSIGLYAELLRDGSRHMPIFPTSVQELWHCHVGYFASSAVAHQRLINANVDMLDLAEPPSPDAAPIPSKPQRAAGIYTMVQDVFDQTAAFDGWLPTALALDEMHEVTNSVFADIVNDSMTVRVGLKGGVNS